MITIILFALCAYISVISVVSVVVCCYDKVAAKRWTKHRTRESTLLLLSAIGGSVAMPITMLIIASAAAATIQINKYMNLSISLSSHIRAAATRPWGVYLIFQR